LATLFDAAFKVVYPTIKGPTPNLTSGETPVKFTHACFPPTYLYTITSTSLSVDLLSCGLVKKDASFFTDTPTCLNTSKSTSLNWYSTSNVDFPPSWHKKMVMSILAKMRGISPTHLSKACSTRIWDADLSPSYINNAEALSHCTTLCSKYNVKVLIIVSKIC